MRRIKSKDTRPEIFVRRLVRSLGFSGYRIHRKDLPGKPDLAWLGRRKAIYVHGCFWHAHNCVEGMRKPKSNPSYWLEKFDRNRTRDAAHEANLIASGWKVLTIWECELRDEALLISRLTSFLTSD